MAGLCAECVCINIYIYIRATSSPVRWKKITISYTIDTHAITIFVHRLNERVQKTKKKKKK